MEATINAETIKAQAHQWTFEGDCSLLQWMQQISQNLDQRANATGAALQQLNANVNRTSTALENVANSLAARQYTQFVESRCHDDDETIANANEVPVDMINEKEQRKSSKEVLQAFLTNNLEMLHNCHEKYALDFDDSDDEGDGTTNYIYQPKNPYNERPLPHIYGTKLWKENWHIGLCDGSNDYSGDELSEAFSESSASAEDNASYGSNAGDLSQSASSTSLLNDNYHANMAIKNASSLRGSQTLPRTRLQPHGDSSSDTSSINSRAAAAGRVREHDLFATLQENTTPTSTSSSVSTAQQQQQRLPTTHAASLSNAHRNVPLLFYDEAPPPQDLFAEPVNAEPVRQSAIVQVKRKPVNLFDDDDFNSFMNEIVEKAQEKPVAPAVAPTPAARQLSVSAEVPKATPRENKNVASLVDNSNETPPPQKVASIVVEKPKKQPLNLFDSPPDSPTDEPLFADKSLPAVANSNTQTIVNKTKITAKSLFDDDDDDDDDFLSAFGSKTLNLPSTIGRRLLFNDNDDDDDVIVTAPRADNKAKEKTTTDKELAPASATKESQDLFATKPSLEPTKPARSKIDLFAESEPIEDDLFAAPTKASVQKPTDLFAKNTVEISPVQEQKKAEDLATLSSKSAEATVEKTAAEKPKQKIDLFATKLFADDEDEDDDLFSKPKTKISKEKPAEKCDVKKPLEKNLAQTTEVQEESNDIFKKTQEEEDKVLNQTLAIEKSLLAVVNTKASAEEHQSTSAVDKPATKDEENVVPNIFANEEVSLFGNVKDKASNQRDDFTADKNDEEKQTILEEEKKQELAKQPQSIDIAKPLKVDKHLDNIFNTTAENLADNKNTNEQANILPAPIPQEQKPATNKTLLFTEPEEDKDELDELFDQLAFNKNKITAATETKTDEVSGKFQDLTVTQKEAEPTQHSNTPATTLEQSNEQQHTVATSDESAPSASSTHNYAGIFLDEPPDDDDFFQALTSNRLSASKLTLDLEHDFYEPALPEPPEGAQTPKDIQKMEATNVNNDYSGLCLFSEIPPEDDDEAEKSAVTVTPQRNVETQRLHSVFYDDFDETRQALQQTNEKQKSIHALFDDEPPADDEQFDIVAKLTKAKQERQVVPEEKEEKTEEDKKKPAKTILTADETDHSAAVNIEASTSQISEETSMPSIAGKLAKLAEASTRLQVEKVASTGEITKLKMPKININVQALLPGAGSKTSLKKTREENNKSAEHFESFAEALAEPTATPTYSTPEAKASDQTNENMLTSVCKNRVRAPATRRPSTRRARQENYRKSLIEEQTVEQEEAHYEQTKATSSRQASISEPMPKLSKSETARKPPMPSDLFGDNDDYDEADLLFSKPKLSAENMTNIRHENNKTNLVTSEIKQSVGMPVKQTILSETATKPAETAKTAPVEIKPTTTKLSSASALKADSSDLLKAKVIASHSTVPTKTSSTTKISKVAKTVQKSLFDDLESDSDDDLFKSAAAKPQKKVLHKDKVVEPTSAPKKSVALFDSDNDDDDFLKTLKKPQKIVASKKAASVDAGKKSAKNAAGSLFSDVESDEDADLFSGSSKTHNIRAVTKSHLTKPLNDPLTSQQAAPPGTTTAALPVPSKAQKTTLADNPLADLLDS